MTWKCPNCGFDANDSTHADCKGGCGYIRFAPFVTLVTSTSADKIRMSIDTRVGKHLLRKLVGDEATFASDAQFKIFRSTALAGWAIAHEPAAKNATYLNGAPLGSDAQKLESGAVISIGPEKAKVTVTLGE